MNVVYSSSDLYSELAATSIVSLLENSKDVDEICIYVIDIGIREKHKQELLALARAYDRQLFFLEDLNVEIVDASIAAELFLFYQPETLLAGYSSTTFVSAEEDKCLALYTLTKNQAYADNVVKEYVDMIDIFISIRIFLFMYYGTQSPRYFIILFKDFN